MFVLFATSELRYKDLGVIVFCKPSQSVVYTIVMTCRVLASEHTRTARTVPQLSDLRVHTRTTTSKTWHVRFPCRMIFTIFMKGIQPKFSFCNRPTNEESDIVATITALSVGITRFLDCVHCPVF
jgi:hypothetical protein